MIFNQLQDVQDSNAILLKTASKLSFSVISDLE